MGGVEVNPPGKYPWQVALISNRTFIPGTDTFWHMQFCGGSLIDEEWVLTAAHCVYENGQLVLTSTINIVAGVHNLYLYDPSGDSQRKDVIKIIVHPDYKCNWDGKQYAGTSLGHDIALLRLSSSVNIKWNADLISLATSDVASGTLATVTGWGSFHLPLMHTDKKSTDDFPYTLQEVQIPIVWNCNSFGGASDAVCAGYMEGGKDSCAGDSGGPLVVESQGWKQLGIVSWGHGCAQPNSPGIYTRVSSYYDWINSKTKRGTLTARVLSLTNQPVSGASVTFTGGSGQYSETQYGTTNSSGYYTFSDVPAGSATVSASKNGLGGSKTTYVYEIGPNLVEIWLTGNAVVPTPTPQPTPIPSGWVQTFFSDNNLGSQCGSSRVESDVYMFRDSEAGWSPPSGCPSASSAWSVRMVRNDAYFQGGTYQFGLFYDDGARLYIDGVLKIDGWSGSQHYEAFFLTSGNHELK